MCARKNGRNKNKKQCDDLSLTGALVALCPFRKQKIFLHKLTTTFKLCFVPMKYKFFLQKEKGRKDKND